MVALSSAVAGALHPTSLQAWKSTVMGISISPGFASRAIEIGTNTAKLPSYTA